MVPVCYMSYIIYKGVLRVSLLAPSLLCAGRAGPTVWRFLPASAGTGTGAGAGALSVCLPTCLSGFRWVGAAKRKAVACAV